MSTLFIVRHGQASFMSENYDQLSALGEAQAQALARHWLAIGMQFDQVYIGPKYRHRQTQDAIAAVYARHDVRWPEPQLLPEIDEHQAFQLMEHVLPELAERDPEVKEMVVARSEAGQAQWEPTLRLLQRVMRMWVRKELEVDPFEPWLAFRTRVQQGLKQIVAANGQNQRVAVFTSTGPVAVAVGEALKLADEPIIELSWAVRNGTYTEFLFSKGRFSLSAFNAASHFQDPELLTYV